MRLFKNFEIARMSMAWMAVLIVAVATFGFASDVKAGTITCSGSATNTSTSYVHFFPSSGTCTIGDTSAGVETGRMLAQLVPSGGNSQVYMTADNNLDGAANTADHLGCTVGDAGTIPANNGCADNVVPSNTYTSTITANISAAGTATLSVTYVVVANTSITVTSASVTGSGISDSSPSASAFQTLQASVSRSQAAIVDANVGARIASAAASKDEEARRPSLTSFAPTFGLTQFDQLAGRSNSRGTSMRELAMLASFDTSQMVLVAAGDEQDPIRGIEQRRGALANQPYTVWGHGSFTSVDNTRNRTGDDSRYDGDVWGFNMGLDYRFRPELVAGVSLGYSETDLTTSFNSGTFDETNWTLSPYAMYQPMAGVTLSAIAGYSFGDVDRTRDTTVTGNTDSDMWFASLNGSYEFRPSKELPLDLTANLAVLVARRSDDAFTESDGTTVAKLTSNTRQLKPGIEAAYSVNAQGTTLQPFVKTDYVHDFTAETNGDNGAMNLGGGLRITSGETGLFGSIEGERQVGRDDYKEYTVSGLIAHNFGIGGSGDSKLGIASPYVKANFNPASGQMFGTGLKFASDSGAFNYEFGLTHSMAAAGPAVTAGQARAELKF